MQAAKNSALELLDDLLFVGFSPMLDYWLDEETLVQHGWQPPPTEEGRR